MPSPPFEARFVRTPGSRKLAIHCCGWYHVSKYASCKFRIDLRQHRRDRAPQQAQRLGARHRRERHLRRSIEGKPGILDHFLDAVAGVNAGETKTPLRAVESEQA